jgi:hypothetical protein
MYVAEALAKSIKRRQLTNEEILAKKKSDSE